jgi:hypothetical protein
MCFYESLTAIDLSNCTKLTAAGLIPFFKSPPPNLSTINLDGIQLETLPVMVRDVLSHHTLYTVHHMLYTVHHTLYTVHHTLSTIIAFAFSSSSHHPPFFDLPSG